MAVVAEKNSYSFQIIDASEIESVEVYPNLNKTKESQYVGVAFWIHSKKYMAHTFSPASYRYAFPINMTTEGGKECLRKAHELSIHITNAKEVAMRNKDIANW